MLLLTQFLLRVSFGLALAMATVSPKQVSSGYFRNHLYVILGLSALATLLSRAVAADAFAWALAAAVLSYVASVAWLYEKQKAGIILLVLVGATALISAFIMVETPAALPRALESASTAAATTLRYAQTSVSGLVLGFTMAAMLLGHWYLNAPGMELAPLRRLLVAMALVVAVHAVICSIGLG
ncbi:MAG TPA: hypothetical protein VF175_13155, partial [Lacipirellula sp.]